MEKVEYKDTITLEFVTKRYDSSTGASVEVVPATYSAYLESCETTPEQIVELENIEVVDDSTYWVHFYASPVTDESVESGTAYYIAFYWEYGGIKKCERKLVVVVPDV
jgi:sulfur carrier protein ThiS